MKILNAYANGSPSAYRFTDGAMNSISSFVNSHMGWLFDKKQLPNGYVSAQLNFGHGSGPGNEYYTGGSSTPFGGMLGTATLYFRGTLENGEIIGSLSGIKDQFDYNLKTTYQFPIGYALQVTHNDLASNCPNLQTGVSITGGVAP